MSARLDIKVVADAAGAAKELDKVGTAADGMASKMGKGARVGALAVGGGLVAIGAKAGDLAAQLQDSSGAVDAVFKDHAATVHAAAANAAQSVGLSEDAYKKMASTMGAQLTNMGTAQADLAGETDSLIGTAADLAAQFGGSTADAVGALSSLMRGETDPIEKYGISIKQADIEAKKAELGLKGLTGEADKAAQKQAIMALLTQQSASSAGAFARETGNANVAQQQAAAAAENAGAKLGTVLLPAMTKGAQMAAQMADFVARNSTAFTVLAVVLGTVAAGVLLYQGVMAVIPAVTAAVTAAQWLWNAAMTANPIGLVVLGIVALIAVIVLVVRHWDTVKAAAAAAWEGIKVGAAAVWEALQAMWAAITAAAAATWDAITAAAAAVWDAITAGAENLRANVVAKWQAIQAAAAAVWDAIAAGAASLWARIQSAADTGRDVLVGAFDLIKSAGASFVAPAIAALERLQNMARNAASAVSGVIDKAKNIGSGIKDFFASAPPSGLVMDNGGPAQFAAGDDWGFSGRLAGSGGVLLARPVTTTVNITFTGLVTDPAGTAREIKRLLADHDALTGSMAR